MTLISDIEQLSRVLLGKDEPLNGREDEILSSEISKRAEQLLLNDHGGRLFFFELFLIPNNTFHYLSWTSNRLSNNKSTGL